MQFTKFIKSILPEYLLENDSHKNSDGKGLLERFMQNFGEEIDEELYPFLTDFLDNLLNPLLCDPKYLIHISFILGLPPTIDNNTATYRRILMYAVQIYKLKGTKKSYQLLFNLIGINIEILEETPRKSARYDDGLFYDDNNNYDQDCDNCSYYTILYYDPLNPLDPVPQPVLDLFSKIICFVQPINAKLRGYVRSLYIEDEILLEVGEDVLGFNTTLGGAFSDGFDTEFAFQ